MMGEIYDLAREHTRHRRKRIDFRFLVIHLDNKRTWTDIPLHFFWTFRKRNNLGIYLSIKSNPRLLLYILAFFVLLKFD